MVVLLFYDLKMLLMFISVYVEVFSVDVFLELLERWDYWDVLFGNVEWMKYMIGEFEMYMVLGFSELEMVMVEVDGEEFFDMLFGSYGGFVECG